MSSSCIKKNREEFNAEIETYTWENHNSTEKIGLFWVGFTLVIAYAKEIILVSQVDCDKSTGGWLRNGENCFGQGTIDKLILKYTGI